jgi:hypothetical protein
MEPKILVTDEMVARYFDLFVNRRAYTVQSPAPHPETGRHYYYRPKAKHDGPKPLSRVTIKSHLEGALTIGLYAINPQSQRSKWVVIDADYSDALEDLLKLQWELRRDGVDAALEKSRRGGHLWIFAEKPLLARDCRVYIYNLARGLKVPVKGGSLAVGIEVFPRQSELRVGEFGNAIRGPLGIHRGAGRRYWFYGADYRLTDQIGYLGRLKRITEAEMSSFVAGLEMPQEFRPKPSVHLPPYDPNRREFHILDYVTAKRRNGRNYWTRCPACAQQGRDRSGDNLAISTDDPRKYRCWAGCSREMIRAALGCPIRNRKAS